MKISFALLCAGVLSTLNAAEMEHHQINPSEIRVMPVSPTVEPDEVNLKILFPEEGDIKNSQPIHMLVRLDGFPLRTDSDFPRKKEIFNDPEGQSVHIVVDNFPYFAVDEAIVDALDDAEEYFEQKLEFDFPMTLSSGMHVARLFPVRSYNESLKGEGCFNARIFYIHDKEGGFRVDLSQPYLTYNEPQGHFDYNPREPILLDFYLTNCQLSKDGYKVRLSINGEVHRIISSWTPYFIYGLQRGAHTIRLQLLDQENKPVPGLFNTVERKIYVD